MKRDPKPRKDGMCANKCGQPKCRRDKKAYATKAQFDRDPFCSRACCEAYHEVAA